MEVGGESGSERRGALRRGERSAEEQREEVREVRGGAERGVRVVRLRGEDEPRETVEKWSAG
jgi:hypothetical protein